MAIWLLAVREEEREPARRRQEQRGEGQLATQTPQTTPPHVPVVNVWKGAGIWIQAKATHPLCLAPRGRPWARRCVCGGGGGGGLLGFESFLFLKMRGQATQGTPTSQKRRWWWCVCGGGGGVPVHGLLHAFMQPLPPPATAFTTAPRPLAASVAWPARRALPWAWHPCMLVWVGELPPHSSSQKLTLPHTPPHHRGAHVHTDRSHHGGGVGG